MSNETHTGGEWTTGHDGHGGMYVYAGDRQVGYVSSGPEQEANARLIVSAPALLAALKAVEWSGGGNQFDCIVAGPSCGKPRNSFDPDVSHKDGCQPAAALAGSLAKEGADPCKP